MSFRVTSQQCSYTTDSKVHICTENGDVFYSIFLREKVVCVHESTKNNRKAPKHLEYDIDTLKLASGVEMPSDIKELVVEIISRARN